MHVICSEYNTYEKLINSFIGQFYEHRYFLGKKKKKEDELEYIHLDDSYLPKFTGQFILNQTEPKETILFYLFPI